MDYYIVDNFFNADMLKKVVEESKTLNYYNQNNNKYVATVGNRTSKINVLKPEIFEAVKESIDGLLNKDCNYELYFHKLSLADFPKHNKPSVIRNNMPKVHLMKDEDWQNFNLSIEGWHRDDVGYSYAGVVYLNENPYPNTGTLLEINEKVIPIENNFNRLALYKANILHRVENVFPDENDPRLTLTIFVK